MLDLDKIYDNRFFNQDNNPIWVEICDWFNRSGIVNDTDTVCDIACGNGEFINNIRCKAKYGVDIRSGGSGRLAPDVRFVSKNALTIEAEDFPGGVPNVVFISNFLEHLDSKNDVITLLNALNRVLRRAANSRCIILGPNIDYTKERYWDFIDHKIALNAKSITEALEVCDFRVKTRLSKFLPYTTKSNIPQNPALVRLYLRCRPAWAVMGKQFLFVAEPNGSGALDTSA
jgi:hypothetical protein